MDRAWRLLALLVFLTPAAAHGQSAGGTLSSTTAAGRPYAAEDVPRLEARLEATRAEFGELRRRRPRPVEALRTVQDELERLQAALSDARRAPSLAQLQARLVYDQQLARLRNRIRPLLIGSEAPGQELLGVQTTNAELTDFLDTRKDLLERESPPLAGSEGATELEKVAERVREAEEAMAFTEKALNLLNQQVFPSYSTWETAARAALLELGKLEQSWAALEAKARRYPERAVSPDEFAGDLVFGPERSIRATWELLSGSNEALGIRQHQGRLAALRAELEEQSFARDRRRLELARLRPTRTLDTPAASATPVATSAESSGYSVKAEQMSVAEAWLDRLSLEIERIKSQIEERKGEKADRQSRLEDYRERIEKAKKAISNNDGAETSLGKLALARGGWPDIRGFVLDERLDSLEKGVDPIRASIRRSEIRIVVLEYRLSSANEEQREIRESILPKLRREYYSALGSTFAVRGLRVAIVLAVAYLILKLIKRGGTSLIDGIISRTLERQGAAAIRQQRARTLISVFAGAARFIIYVLATLFVVGQLDVDYGPLLVAAGGLSLAVGFGAQSLVKDFFAGFFILLEGQYSIGDVVDIHGKAGIVEDLNLRTTILRSLEGEVHTIPNGDISVTTNKTKYWSRAIVDVGIAYEEDVDQVMAVLARLGENMKNDEAWSPKLRSVEVLGVEKMADSAIVIRVLVETSAGNQWAASREYQRRIKIAFDRLGIEIPWPQRVVTHKVEETDLAKTNRKRRAIQKYIGRPEARESSAIDSFENRDRKELLAQKEASLLASTSDIEPSEPTEEIEPEPTTPDKT